MWKWFTCGGIGFALAVWGCGQGLEPTATDGVGDVSSVAAAALTTPTGHMAYRRESFTLTALSNGKAVAAGGWGGTPIMVPAVLSTAELYNPASSTFAIGSALPGPRSDHTATVLANGRVLIAGGWTAAAASPTTAAQFYIPEVDSWSTTGSMVTARSNHAAARLADGRVLVAGGLGASNTILDSVEIWNPVTGNWGSVAHMNSQRWWFTLTALADGRALAVGGLAGPGVIAATAEIYDPASDHWTIVPGLLPRYGHRAFMLPDGRVLIAGGTGSLNGGISNTVLPVIQVFDPSLGQWVNPSAMLVVSRADYEGVVLPSGDVVIAGGSGASGQAIADVEVISTANLNSVTASTLASPMAFARTGLGLALLTSGKVLVAGGTNGAIGTMADAELLDPVCAPKTCADQGFACGAATDTCGTTLNCGTCAAGQTCTAQHQCCTPTSCAAQGVTCGSLLDGCGGILTCGSCAAGSTCQSGACVPVLDSAPPTVSITAPTAGAVVSGTVTLTAAASDDVAVTQVELYDGTVLLGTCGQAPCSVAWNTVPVSAGAHTLTAIARDAAGNAGISAGVAVTVNNSPAAIVTATYDVARAVPSCLVRAAGCDTAALVDGRGPLGPEAHAPNTINGGCSDGTFGRYHADESIDRVKIFTPDGSPMLPGATVQVQATAWVYSTTDRLDVWRAADATNPSWTLVGTVAPTASGAQILSLSYVLPAGTLQAVRTTLRYGGSALVCTTGGFDDHDDVVFATQ